MGAIKSEAIKDAIHNLVARSEIYKKKGCFSYIDAVTGSGKTYQAENFLMEQLTKSNGKSVFFCTNVLKNVQEPYESLKKKIVSSKNLDAQEKEDLLSRVVLIPSNENVIQNYIVNEDFVSKLSLIMSPPQYQNFKATVERYKNLSRVYVKHNNEHSQRELIEIQSHILNQITRTLKKLDLDEVEPSIKEILYKIFPAQVLLASPQNKPCIIFATTKKLLLPWRCFEGNFETDKYLKTSILILDEFDRQQSEMLEHFLKSASNIDVIGMSKKIYGSYNSLKIPETPEFFGAHKCFAKFELLLQQYTKEWNPDYLTVIDENVIYSPSDSTKGIFTMSTDRYSIRVISHRGKPFNSVVDHIEKVHLIGFEEGKSAIRYINESARLCKYFSLAIFNVANLLLEHNKHKKGINLSSMVGRALNVFSLSAIQKDIAPFLLELKAVHASRDLKDYSFHFKGFNLTRLLTFNENDNTALANAFNLQMSATGYLLSWINSGTTIIGLSATSSAPTAIHNFDIAFMKKVLGERFLQLSHDEEKAIREEYKAKRQYDKNDIRITASNIANGFDYVDVDELVAEFYKEKDGVSLKKKFLNYKLAELLDPNRTEPVESGNSDSSFFFQKERLRKIITSIALFSVHETNRYHCCMINKSFKGAEFSEFMAFVGNYFGVVIYENINSESYRNGVYDEMLSLLSSSTQKVAFITNYQGMGAGVSPSYKFTEQSYLHYIGSDISPSRRDTDIDSMYLECPSSLFGYPVTSENQSDKNNALLKLIHNILICHEKGIFTASDSDKYIGRLIRNGNVNLVLFQLACVYKKSNDYRAAVIRWIEQAIGRMIRTEWKQKDISIYYDNDHDFIDILASDIHNLRLKSYEYSQLVKQVNECYGVNAKKEEGSNYSIAASRSFSRMEWLIENVYEHQNEQDMENYKELRSTLLTLSPFTKNKPDGYSSKHYIMLDKEADCYYYKRENDTNNRVINISVSTSLIAGGREVSFAACRLKQLLANDVVREHFKKNNFAIEFNRCNYAISPSGFDVYLGAIGEEAVFSLLDHHGLIVNEMPRGVYEWFDGYIEFEGFIALIDVKHWNLSHLSRDNTVQKCMNKLSQLRASPPEQFKGKKMIAFYINTIHENDIVSVTRKLNEDNLLVHCELIEADIVEVPGLIHEADGSSNVYPFSYLLDSLNTLKAIS